MGEFSTFSLRPDWGIGCDFGMIVGVVTNLIESHFLVLYENSTNWEASMASLLVRQQGGRGVGM